MNQTMGRRGRVWRTPDITADGLKIFACITMLLQTIGIVVVEKGMIHLEQYTQTSLNEALAADSQLMTLAGIGSVMQLIGGMAIPIFAFLLVEGFRNTSDFRKYLGMMFLAALLSEIPYDFAMSGKLFDISSQNAMLGTGISLLMLKCLDMLKNAEKNAGRLVRILIVLAAVLWVSFLRVEYGLCMVLLTAVFYLFYAKNGWKTILGICISLMYVTGPLSFYGIWCYNGKRKNRIPKYVFYAFYPIQLLVLGIAARYM